MSLQKTARLQMNKNCEQQKIKQKRQKEYKTVLLMIQIFCSHKHKTKAMKLPETLCPECKQLAEYVHTRIEKCIFIETKSFCSFCKIHCYKPEMREKIRTVMRFSGIRMIFYHPPLAIKHAILTIKESKKKRQYETDRTY